MEYFVVGRIRRIQRFNIISMHKVAKIFCHQNDPFAHILDCGKVWFRWRASNKLLLDVDCFLSWLFFHSCFLIRNTCISLLFFYFRNAEYSLLEAILALSLARAYFFAGVCLPLSPLCWFGSIHFSCLKSSWSD